MLDNTMKNDSFPTYVGFFNTSYIVPAYAGDKEFVFLLTLLHTQHSHRRELHFVIFCAA